MTSFKQEPGFADPSSSSQCIDPLDSFINYDQAVVPTPSVSPLSSRSKSISTPTSTSASLQQNNLLPIPPSPQTFSAPSHQYGQYRQQAGLPVGALANTFAVNQVDQFNFGRDQFSYAAMPPTDGYFGTTNVGDEFLDFGTTPTQTSNGEMDLDFGSPIDMTLPSNSFINPSTIGTPDTTPRPQSSQGQPARVYPGMHQQAALAKAQAEAARQQQQQQSQELPVSQQHQAGQQQQHRAAPLSHSRQAGRGGNHSKPPTDPIVEESISRLLNQMRHSSVTSSNEDSATLNAHGSQANTRSRKDEEDMDEDERLLASEEGKKLSSKERRQLRNKVSARAFRSRRKEYIGQLEGEIAVKQNENDELRLKNEALTTENTRLTDLTRMLLSSSAFSTFLNDLSASGVPTSIPDNSQSQNMTTTSQSDPVSQQKDINSNQGNTQQASDQQANNMHVGLTMIPEESTFNHNLTGPQNASYNNNLDFGGLYDAQVYAVTSIPQGPAPDSIEFSMLHGKSSNFVGPHSDDDEGKGDPPVIGCMPSVQKLDQPEAIDTPLEDDDVDLSDPAFALFIDQPSSDIGVMPPTVGPENCIFGEIELEKAFGRVELVLAEESSEIAEVSAANIERFQRLCSRLEASSARIAAIMGCP